jgi:hypothetical protein
MGLGTIKGVNSGENTAAGISPPDRISETARTRKTFQSAISYNQVSFKGLFNGFWDIILPK